MAIDWDVAEVEAIVRDYMSMLHKEVTGIPYSKTVHRNELKELLNGRTDGSIERKHQNISAVLIANGFPYISGYKPLKNYQRLLWDSVIARIDGLPELERDVEKAIDSDVPSLPKSDLLSRLEAPPVPDKTPTKSAAYEPAFLSTLKRRQVDYLAREAKNTALGGAGELFVLEFEAARLHSAGQQSLANRIEHVSKSKGDSAGYDVLSFDTNGRERFIEGRF